MHKRLTADLHARRFRRNLIDSRAAIIKAGTVVRDCGRLRDGTTYLHQARTHTGQPCDRSYTVNGKELDAASVPDCAPW